MKNRRPRLNLDDLARLADEFWQDDPRASAFPRDLEPALLLRTPVFVERLDGLSPARVQAWLAGVSFPVKLKTPDRPLNGCVVAYREHAAIFLDAALAADEARVILAHELGHYLAEYDWPRRRVLARLGASVLPVLDGHRKAEAPEEWAAALAGVSLHEHVHFMERAFDPRAIAAHDRAERTANELACELLAPAGLVLQQGRTLDLGDDPAGWEGMLTAGFGFPRPWAWAYAERLAGLRRRRRTFTDVLGL
jgi:hypothetical protein